MLNYIRGAGASARIRGMSTNAQKLAEKLAADRNRKKLSPGFGYFIAWWENHKARRRRARARAVQRYNRDHGFYASEEGEEQ